MLTMLAPQEFQNIASYYPLGSQVTWQKLQAECAAASTANLAQGPFTVYNQATCGEFNKFLVATLIGNAQVLKRWGDAKTLADRVRAATSVFRLSSILWSVMDSRAFRLHLAVLGRDHRLVMPNYHWKDHYKTFATQNSMIYHDLVAGVKEGGAGENNGGSDENNGDVDVDLEFETSPEVLDQHGMDAAYRRSLSLCVAHIGGIWILEKYCQDVASKVLPPEVHFQAPLFAVQRPVATISHGDLLAAIREYLPDPEDTSIIEDIIRAKGLHPHPMVR
jgi:hypothetical protein